MEPDGDLAAGEIFRAPQIGIARDHDAAIGHAIGTAPHDAFFHLGGLVYRPVAGAADIARAGALAAMAVGIVLIGARNHIGQGLVGIQGFRIIGIGAAVILVDFVIEPGIPEITLFVGDLIIEPSVGLDREFRHFVHPCNSWR